eukprot:TRINITY_DN1957_c5_g1_i2.p1 TRINITY_DN1957_c5_g1~~TRINITY_DN1957_c5_g1_i2.p1  ORF type:complete len:1383 (-),score=352.48 TRINITY_DN1957_c5_g1_i2:139-4287(-)
MVCRCRCLHLDHSKLAITLSKSEEYTPETISLLHRVVSIVISVMDALPSIDLIPGRKELAMLMTFAVATPPRSNMLLSMLESTDYILHQITEDFEGDNRGDPVRIESSAVYDLDVLWSTSTVDTLSNISIWTPLPKRVLVDSSLKITPKLIGPLHPKKALDVIKYLFRCHENARDDRVDIETNIFCCLLSYLKYLMKNPSQINDADGKSAEYASLYWAIVQWAEPHLSSKNVLFVRASSEIMGMIASLQGEAGVWSLAKRLTSFITSPNTAAQPVNTSSLLSLATGNVQVLPTGFALALSCVHRYSGAHGTSISKESLKLISSLSKNETDIQQRAWVLHCLYMIFNGNQVVAKSEIDMQFQIISDAINVETTDEASKSSMLFIVGRMINNMLPHLKSFSSQSQEFLKLKSIVYYLKVSSTGAPSLPKLPSPPSQWSSIIIETTVFFSKLLTLQIPFFNFDNPLDFTWLLNYFEFNLSHRKPEVRQSSIKAILQLQSANFGKFDVKLFVLLDMETVKSISDDIKKLILLRLRTVKPSQFISICREIFVGKSGSSSISNETEDGDDSGILKKTEEALASTSWSPSISTQMFSVFCIRHVLEYMKNQKPEPEPEHFDLILANNKKSKGKSSNDWLIHSFQSLVDIGLRAASSNVNEIRCVALYLIDDLYQLFGNARDPDYDGHYLIEVTEGQVGLILRGALKQSDHPQLKIIAATLMGNIVIWIFNHYEINRAIKTTEKYIVSLEQLLKSILVSRGLPALSKFFKPSLSSPKVPTRDDGKSKEEDNDDDEEDNLDTYTDAQIATLHLSILETYAQIHVGTNHLHRLLPPSTFTTLHVQWMDIVRDCAVIITQPNSVKYSYDARFYTLQLVSRPDIMHILLHRWSTVLKSFTKKFPEEKETSTSSSSSAGDVIYHHTSMEEFYIVLGLITHVLSLSTSSTETHWLDKHRLSCVDALGGLLLLSQNTTSPSSSSSSSDSLLKPLTELPVEVLYEILSLINTLKNDENDSVKISILTIFVKFVQSLGHHHNHDGEYLKNSSEMCSIIADIVKGQLNSKFQTVESGILVLTMITHLLPLLQVDDQFIVNAVLWLVNYLDTPNILPAVVQQTLTTIQELTSRQTKYEGDSLKYATINSLLVKAQKHEKAILVPDINNNEHNQDISSYQVIMLSLLTILTSLNHTQKDHSHIKTHHRISQIILNILNSDNKSFVNLQVIVITLYNRFIESCLNSSPDTEKHKVGNYYIHQLTPQFVLLLNQRAEHVSLNQTELSIYIEMLKQLVSLHTHSSKSNPNGMLDLLIPTLIDLLHVSPNGMLGSLHQAALQLILGMAQTNPQAFPGIIEKLSPERKNKLVIAHQLNAQREQQRLQMEKEMQARAGGKLTLDISKF